MSTMLEPPAERDLPPGHAARRRADLMRALPDRRNSRSPAGRKKAAHTRRWVAAAGTLALAAIILVRPEHRPETLALGAAEMSPSLRAAADQCLAWQRGPGAGDAMVTPIVLADVAVAAEYRNRALVLFLTDEGYAGCELSDGDAGSGPWPAGRMSGKEVSGGLSISRWEHRDWLPGPVQRLALSSSEPDGGWVAVTGRVSARVHRLVLEHGNGHTTTARLARGAFGIMTTGSDVQPDAELVSYDDSDQVIDRRALFQPFDRCYTDPTGKIIAGDPGAWCLPADPWSR
ncbi:hypothetical protein ACWKSP_15765 [Micromonosporaceae bacterium Da 78-11]